VELAGVAAVADGGLFAFDSDLTSAKLREECSVLSPQVLQQGTISGLLLLKTLAVLTS
jgi:hypothetical protein